MIAHTAATLARLVTALTSTPQSVGEEHVGPQLRQDKGSYLLGVTDDLN